MKISFDVRQLRVNIICVTFFIFWVKNTLKSTHKMILRLIHIETKEVVVFCFI